MRPVKKHDEWMQMASQVSEKLLEALEQLSTDSQSSSVCASEHNDLSTITRRREVAIEQLKSILESFSVPDLVDIPVETLITDVVLADQLLRELKELGLLVERLNSNVSNLEDIIANRIKRDENLVEIIKGLKKQTEAIEDENDEEEFENLRRMKHDIREVLNTILDEAYPEMKGDVKTVIQALYEVKDEEDPYIQVPEKVDPQVIMLLLTAKMIKQHETDQNLISLMI